MQLDDFDVDRQREELARSRPGTLPPERQEGAKPSDEQEPQQDKR